MKTRYMISPFVDAHVHLNTTSLAKMEKAVEWGASFVSINTAIPFFVSLDKQREAILSLADQFPGRVKFITSFTVDDWGKRNWSELAIQQICLGMESGAVGVKIWKNIGMDLKDTDGNFVMIDHQRFDPVFDYLEQNDILVLGHLGEPKNCWLPLADMTVDSDRNYFSAHPEYHMHLHPDFPSYEKQLESRDNRLRRHSKLKFVGLHLASLEWSVKEVGQWLDTFPTAMVDLAERICHLQYQCIDNWEEVRTFMIKYQDRIIYGTDVIDDGGLPEKDIAKLFEKLWAFHWKYFSTHQVMQAQEFPGEFLGLDLPEEVLIKIFRINALNTYGFKNF